MRVLGANKGKTYFGKVLRDGGVAIIEDGKLIVAIPEERTSREKAAGGFVYSLSAVLNSLHITMNDFDLVVLSTCCESEDRARLGHHLEGHKNLITVNHHLSHAYKAFFQSGFDEALVVVVDGGGNTFSNIESENWWHLPREQHSYFVADKTSTRLVDRDFFNPYEVGFGELYRAFTYYLGFGSARFASQTMALAAFGMRDRFGKRYCIQITDGHLVVPLENDSNDPIGMVRHLGQTIGLDFGEPREPTEEILSIHRDLAAYIQMCVEDMFIEKLRWLKDNFPSKNLCLSGGFFLNCVVNGRIAKEGLFDNVYVPSAPGDSGQCIGNAIYGAVSHGTNASIYTFTCKKSEDVALGLDHTIDYPTLSEVLVNSGCQTYVTFEPQSLPTIIAKLVSSDTAVAVFEGRSEIGPRALGHRSILADPRNEHARYYLNQLKSREWFMTFAPVIFRDRCQELFDMWVESPFMSFAVPTKKDICDRIPAVVSKDGTSRIQTVERGSATFIGNVLTQFEHTTGMPVLLNTSFNRGGEPIVESLQDAVQSFSQAPINALVLNRFLVVKKLTPQFIELGLLASSYDIPIKIHDREEGETNFEGNTPYELIHWIQHNTGQIVFVRNYFPLYKEYIKLVDTHKKQTTTRFRPYSAEIPSRILLPLLETDDFGKPKTNKITRWAEIVGITYKRFGELTDEDANKDGFESTHAMRDKFTKEIYPGLKDKDWVTIYSIRWNDGGAIQLQN